MLGNFGHLHRDSCVNVKAKVKVKWTLVRRFDGVLNGSKLWQEGAAVQTCPEAFERTRGDGHRSAGPIPLFSAAAVSDSALVPQFSQTQWLRLYVSSQSCAFHLCPSKSICNCTPLRVSAPARFIFGAREIKFVNVVGSRAHLAASTGPPPTHSEFASTFAPLIPRKLLWVTNKLLSPPILSSRWPTFSLLLQATSWTW